MKESNEINNHRIYLGQLVFGTIALPLTIIAVVAGGFVSPQPVIHMLTRILTR